MHPWPWHGALKTKAAISRRGFSTCSGTKVLAPAIWPLELVNTLLMAERRKRITVAQVTALLRRIAGLPISIDPTRLGHAFDQIPSVARQQNLSAYDAVRHCPWPPSTVDYDRRPGASVSLWSRSEARVFSA